MKPAIDPVSYAAQAIDGAIDDLLTEAQRLASVADAVRLATVARALRARLDLVAGLAGMHADPWARVPRSFTEGGS